MDVDNLVNMTQRVFKSAVLILAMEIEGTKSQMFYLGHSSGFMHLRKLCLT